jgi:hypothetical protein
MFVGKARSQGDQNFEGKITQILEKVAQTVAKPKNAKISSSKLNLKIQNINIRPPFNS